MWAGNANPDGEDTQYSKINLEDVDSWLPPEIALSLSRMIAARNRKDLEEGISPVSHAIDLAAPGIEPEGPSLAKGDRHILPGSEFLVPDSVESSEVGPPEAAVPSDDSHADQDTEDSGGEADASWGDGIPFF